VLLPRATKTGKEVPQLAIEYLAAAERGIGMSVTSVWSTSPRSCAPALCRYMGDPLHSRHQPCTVKRRTIMTTVKVT
jgi:hypothetical protein